LLLRLRLLLLELKMILMMRLLWPHGSAGSCCRCCWCSCSPAAAAAAAAAEAEIDPDDAVAVATRKRRVLLLLLLLLLLLAEAETETDPDDVVAAATRRRRLLLLLLLLSLFVCLLLHLQTHTEHVAWKTTANGAVAAVFESSSSPNPLQCSITIASSKNWRSFTAIPPIDLDHGRSSAIVDALKHFPAPSGPRGRLAVRLLCPRSRCAVLSAFKSALHLYDQQMLSQSHWQTPAVDFAACPGEEFYRSSLMAGQPTSGDELVGFTTRSVGADMIDLSHTQATDFR
jgi:hypothetical protein